MTGAARVRGSRTALWLQRLAVLRDDARRESFVRRHRRLLRPEVVQQLAEEVRQRVRVNTAEALHLAEAAVLIAEEVGDPMSRGLGFRAKANALFTLGQNRESAQLHQRAIALFRECGNPVELAKSLSAAIQPVSNQGLYDQALAMAEEARHIFTAQQDSLRLARLDINFANILFRQDRFAEALAAYERARDVLWPDRDVEGAAVVTHNMAVCLISLNDFDRAQAEYERARELSERHNMPALVLQADYNIAYLHYLRGEYRRAIDGLIAAREAARAFGDRQHLALCHLDLSVIYLELNLHAEAAAMAETAFHHFEALGMRYEASKSLANRAIATGMRGDLPAAMALFEQARQGFVQERNPVWPAVIDLYRAFANFEAGRDEEARRLCSAAWEHFSDAASDKAVLNELLFARLALRAGGAEEALDWCTRAARRAAGLGSPNLSYQTAVVRGNVLESLGRPSEAYESYETAHAIAETLRSSLRSDELKIGFMSNKHEVYQRLVDLTLAGAANGAGDSQTPAFRAFGYIQQAKSRGLRDLVFAPAEGASDPTGQVHRLREELNWFYHRIEAQEFAQPQEPKGRIGELREQVKERERQLARLIRETPAAGAHSFDESAVISLDAIRGALPEGAALIEYFRSGERLLAAVLTRGGLDLTPLAEIARVAPRLRMLQFQLARIARAPESAAAALPAMQVHLRELYEELIAPLRSRLDGCRRLIVAPHDALHQLPFAALMDGAAYLIDTFSIAYAPSASVFALCRTRPRTGASRSLIMGVPDAKAWLIEDEVRAIADLLPDAELYLGQQATAAVLEEKGQSSRLIHIAAHGNFRQDNPLFSNVRLGDGPLNAYDLYRLRLPADLITLSGCVTGVNVLAQGDELLGLERGLLHAGARALLLTLWNVNDSSTAEFMRRFYERLDAFDDQSDAVRSAALEIRERYPNPYFWAPFALIGNGSGNHAS